MAPTGRAYVVGAYVPNGGTYMAYHLGRILQLDFGFDVAAVTVADERAEDSIFHYEMHFPTIALAEMEQRITSCDLLIANPSFSDRFFGLRLPGRKIMYIQDFKTFALLDRCFDHYVCVSRFVARFVGLVYRVKAPVIPAFIELDRLPDVEGWRARSVGSILIHLKGDPTYTEAVLKRLRDAVARRLAGVDLDNLVGDQRLPHADFLARLGACRYLVNLSAAEGFGLVPLEAMAMGTTVIGFDGFGGREYMIPGQNCLVTSYPDIEGVAERLVAALGAPAFAERLAEAGRVTASQFGRRRFQAAWHDEFQRILAADEVPCPT
jgi:hypothetical protein